MELKSVPDIADAWTDDVFRHILRRLDFAEVAEIEPSDLREMSVMALQDVAPEKAAEQVLAVLVDGLSIGVRRNLAQEMKAQPMWEEFGNPVYHMAIFLTAVLLHQAFPKTYPKPEIARIILQVTASNTAATRHLSAPTPAVATRLLAAGMDEHSTLRRMYAAPLASGSFPEAATIIWHIQVREQVAKVATWVVYAPWYWLRPLQSVQGYSATLKLD
jgi:hypothetical protein